MKNLTLVLLLLTGLHGSAQIVFEPGWFINNQGNRIECSIKNVGWKNNPTQFVYKLSEGENEHTGNLDSVSEFYVSPFSTYRRQIVDMDRSGTSASSLSTSRSPEYTRDTVFLKVLMEGSAATLYGYTRGDLVRFFYRVGNAEIRPLVYKLYLDPENKIRYNTGYKNQLTADLQCDELSGNRIASLPYNQKALVKIFADYNRCMGDTGQVQQPEHSKSLHLTLRPRLNVSRLSVTEGESLNKDVDFNTIVHGGAGVELEWTLPFNQNKWSVLLEPGFAYFSTRKAVRISSVDMMAEVLYKGVELPFGVRYRTFLNETWNVFLNAGGILNVDLGSTLDYTVLIDENKVNFKHLDFSKLRLGVMLGAGVQFRTRWSAEVRYYPKTDALQHNNLWNADLSTTSFIVGYTLF